ncbi:MAG: putative molybdenum carrier protein [Chromatiales bacterium]|nr:putative molybdenum carrier protein [Chromatiales bacterium]
MQSLSIISGGQSGVDRAALDVAMELEVPCGGWCPQGRLAEDGTIDARYPLKETATTDYTQRTQCNVEDSDATVVVYFDQLEGGTKLTVEFCHQAHKPMLLIDANAQGFSVAVDRLLDFIRDYKPHRLNIAGPRASKQSAAYAYTKALLTACLTQLQITLMATKPTADA